MQFRLPTGEEVISDAIVFLNADVSVEDYLFEGESDAADPTGVEGAVQVRGFEKTPDLRNLDHLRKALI